MRLYRFLLCALSLHTGVAWAQSIYTCTDAQGRKITADRPIMACSDRAQQELTPSGLVKRQIGPSLTAKERVAQEEKEQLLAEAREREAEEKRRDRALLLRYPNPAVHDQERSTALAQIDEVIQAASHRMTQLNEQRQAMNNELGVDAKNSNKLPAALKQRLAENDASIKVQKNFIDAKEQDKKRVNRRFDEERVKLKKLWSLTQDAARLPSAKAQPMKSSAAAP